MGGGDCRERGEEVRLYRPTVGGNGKGVGSQSQIMSKLIS